MNSKNSTPSEIATLLGSLKRIVVISHYNPDPDAYGSSCALTLALQQLGKEVVCVNESGIIPRFSFIPGVSKIQNVLPSGKWDALVACDCGDSGRVGDSLRGSLGLFPIVVNIDHHASNDLFGQYNYVLPGASSAAEIIYDVLEAMKVVLSPDIATCLFTGISADTGSFRYSATSERTFFILQRLVAAGASPYKIGQELYGSSTLAAVLLQAHALAALELHSEKRIAAVTIPNAMFQKFGATHEDADALVERARDIEGVMVSILYKQQADLWRVSLRSKAMVDVSKVATHFGGGGHKVAAAFRWRKSIDELKPLLLAEIQKQLAQ